VLLTHVPAPFETVQLAHDAPQCFGSIFGSTHSASHWAFGETQVVVHAKAPAPFGAQNTGQATPHFPQAALVVSWVSQPLAGFESQSPKPGLQSPAVNPQAPATQLAFPFCGLAHAVQGPAHPTFGSLVATQIPEHIFSLPAHATGAVAPSGIVSVRGRSFGSSMPRIVPQARATNGKNTHPKKASRKVIPSLSPGSHRPAEDCPGEREDVGVRDAGASPDGSPGTTDDGGLPEANVADAQAMDAANDSASGSATYRNSLSVCWTDAACPRALAISHGGDWTVSGNPYDSNAALEAAFANGADVSANVTANDVQARVQVNTARAVSPP
jgi:hypothetical protein